MKSFMDNSENDTDDVKDLFNQYLEICNQAIEHHKDEFPYKELLKMGGAILTDRPIDLAIYDDQPKGAFTLHLINNKLANGGQPTDVKKAWRMNLSYLKQVVEHPQEYIEHPEQLDIDWLKSRLGVL